MRRSKLVALLMVCVMSFAVVQPAFAERTWGEVGEDTAAGAATGGFWGGIIGAAIGGAALTGAAVGGGTGAVAGASGIITASGLAGFHKELGELVAALVEAGKLTPEQQKALDDAERLQNFVATTQVGMQMYQDYQNRQFQQNWNNGVYGHQLWDLTAPEGLPCPW